MLRVNKVKLKSQHIFIRVRYVNAQCAFVNVYDFGNVRSKGLT